MPTNAIVRGVEEIISLLESRGQTLSTAESITGGGLGAVITSIAGASKIYRGGVIAYSNGAKEDILGVAPSLINTHGVVSEEVAIAMAQGAAQKFSSTWAIATTGVAGPGSSDGVPSGTVWVAIDGPVTQSLELSLAGGRESVRNATVATAIGTFTRILRERTRQATTD